MKTLVKCKEQAIKCAFCGARYRLETPKDYKKIKKRKYLNWAGNYRYEDVLKCKCCNRLIEIKGVGE